MDQLNSALPYNNNMTSSNNWVYGTAEGKIFVYQS